ncbi:uncharacterized protein F4822DRAFT_350148 [Hypoxylon trugodes]|uniref:uncharacterized protein n=1 Tax=Hypoxylon trugodes TaxID=326681 RepID=UPI0021A223E5|nr:uncharacterized protein F4822DRAFT_350148 [Hypoxylon trugodes]KAI1385642.1 hypothetical protein F4822DRAFT_350148 [Hypoxylon trugodes]
MKAKGVGEHSRHSIEAPIFYGVVCSDSPTEVEGGFRSGLDPSGELETISTVQLCSQFLSTHSPLRSSKKSPFTSVTNNLKHAIYSAFSDFHDEVDVAILLIRPGKLNPGGYIECNYLRFQCGLPRDTNFDAEVLVWREIPAESILCRWNRLQIQHSGLLSTIDNYESELPHSFGKMLVDVLGMNPNHIQTKQVFLFLLLRKYKTGPTEDLQTIYDSPDFGLKVGDFDDFLYDAARRSWTDQMLVHVPMNYPRRADAVNLLNDPLCPTIKVQLTNSYSASVEVVVCPTFKSWWMSREESGEMEWEQYRKTDVPDQGFRKWLKDAMNTIRLLGQRSR